ncbi:MAG: nucleotidyltransferase family protein [Planctomycetota bacterium]
MICAIVLAAGRSRRMGVQKLLLPFGGKTVIAHIVDQLLASTIGKVHVVVGHQGTRISRELSGRPVSIVNNPNYKSGMLSSVRCGLRELPRECKAVLVALGDQPSITSKLIDQMLKSFADTEKRILVPLYDGKRGHPILFSEFYRTEILTHYDNVGLRGLLHAHSDDVFELTVSTSAVLSDMDCPEDYRRELALIEKNTKKKTTAKTK